jgi:hypothetical protein
MMSDNNEDDCLVFDTCAVVRDRDVWDAVCDAAERGGANCMKIVDAVEDLDTQHKAEKVSCYDCWRYLPPDEQIGAAVVLFNSAGVEMAGTLLPCVCVEIWDSSGFLRGVWRGRSRDGSGARMLDGAEMIELS